MQIMHKIQGSFIQSQMTMLLICSAIEEEIKVLKEKLSFNFELGKNILIKSLGIGYLEAALNLQGLLLNKKNKITEIIFVGTAGIYHDQAHAKTYSNSNTKTICDTRVINVRSVSLLNAASQLDFSYVPKNSENKIYYPDKDKFSLFMPNTLPAHCVSSLEISKDSQIIKKFLDKNPDLKQVDLVENMELFGIAEVAHKHEIPWNSLLGITNTIAEDAHEQWKANHQTASNKLCDLLFENLKI